MFKKEIATAKELDLRPLGKVIIFRDRQTNITFLLYIDFGHGDMLNLVDIRTAQCKFPKVPGRLK